MTGSASEAFASATAIRKSESCALPGVTGLSVVLVTQRYVFSA